MLVLKFQSKKEKQNKMRKRKIYLNKSCSKKIKLRSKKLVLQKCCIH
uniref:Uncharacterized protein n=1 Tax=Anguilla anguilla TaxID=7936 RepID=A0A0E9WPN1_ANGAN